MPHPLIATIVIGLTLAFVLGAIAHRLRISPIVGYLLAGIAVGPHTPGFVADQMLASELAEIGVILLMFGVGLHFSLRDLWSVGAIAIPGALVQIAAATAMGLGLAVLFGWRLSGGIVFGLALSVASTVVLLRALQERRLLGSDRGRLAVGWLVVEDIVMVLALVLLPTLAPFLDRSGDVVPGFTPRSADVALALGTTVLKVGAFFVVMLVVGRRLIPLLLHWTAHSGSRELFRLSVFAIALGVAYGAAELFGVSFALGAFFAGMILSESELSQQAAAESLPLRDAFAVLFFVSVGMLFDPTILVREALPVLATVLIITIGKSVAALAIVLAFRYPLMTGLTVAVSLAQIGEFSFILAGLGAGLGLLPQNGRDLILAGALLSIMLNPLLFAGLDALRPRLERRHAGGEAEVGPAPAAASELPPTELTGHTIVVGAGRVGGRVISGLAGAGEKLFVIDENEQSIQNFKDQSIEAVAGSGLAVLAAASPSKARALMVAIPDVFEAGHIVAHGRALGPALTIIARAHSDAEADHLRACGADSVVLGEEQIAGALIERFRAETAGEDGAKPAPGNPSGSRGGPKSAKEG
jgi:CPA2 family monovalent cation:H+ antiporter-2